MFKDDCPGMRRIALLCSMSLVITSLNSGSNGNCYYVGNTQDAVLIDAGISCREIERRLTRLQLDIQKIRAIFISHEHSDHIKGVEVFSRKYRMPVYITEITRKYSRLKLDDDLVYSFSGQEDITIGGLTIHTFAKDHDAGDPHSFTVEHNQVTVGIFTDIGQVCHRVIRHFSTCNAAILEANYDEDMLRTGPYPLNLKQRISGGKGHLSNTHALELFQKYRPRRMSHLILAHLSEKNNKPELVSQLFKSYASEVQIIVASRHKETPVFEISEPFSKQPVHAGKSHWVQGKLGFDR